MKPKFTDRTRLTQNGDDYKVLLVGAFCTIVIFIGAFTVDHIALNFNPNELPTQE